MPIAEDIVGLIVLRSVACCVLYCTPTPSLSLSPSLSLPVSLSPSLSLPPCLSPYLSLSLPVSLSLSL